jgi:6 kDa early secretory antigenic target
MDGTIKVGFAALEALAQDIGGQVSAIEGHIETLRGQIAQLEGMWVGGAQSGFQATKLQWDQSAEHLKVVLAKVQTAVVQSADGYKTTEDLNTRRWDA